MAPRRRIAAAHLEPFGEVREPVGPPALGGRRQGAGAAGLGDHARGALGPDEQLGQVRARQRHAARCRRCGLRRSRRPGPPPGRSPCPRSSRSGSSTGRRRGTRPSRPPWRGPSTAASARGSCPRARRLGLEVGTEGPRQDLGDAATWCRRRRRPRQAAHVEGTPPNTGMLDPHTPDRPAAGRDRHPGVVAAASTAATCSVSVGSRHRGRPVPGPSPLVAHRIASGHQSRPASARCPSSTVTSAQQPRKRPSNALVDGDARSRDALGHVGRRLGVDGVTGVGVELTGPPAHGVRAHGGRLTGRARHGPGRDDAPVGERGRITACMSAASRPEFAGASVAAIGGRRLGRGLGTSQHRLACGARARRRRSWPSRGAPPRSPRPRGRAARRPGAREARAGPRRGRARPGSRVPWRPTSALDRSSSDPKRRRPRPGSAQLRRARLRPRMARRLESGSVPGARSAPATPSTFTTASTVSSAMSR